MKHHIGVLAVFFFVPLAGYTPKQPSQSDPITIEARRKTINEVRRQE